MRLPAASDNLAAKILTPSARGELHIAIAATGYSKLWRGLHSNTDNLALKKRPRGKLVSREI